MHPPKIQEAIESFKELNKMEIYEQLVWHSKHLKEFPENAKTVENKVPGCISEVYITARLENGKIYFSGTSNAILVKGLVALLIEGLNGLTSEQIQNVNPVFLQELGLTETLTPSRMNASYNILELMKKKAQSLKHRSK